MDTIQAFSEYLKENLGIPVALSPWDGQSGLPLVLRNSYGYYQLIVLEHMYLVLVDEDAGKRTPGMVLKHVNLLGDHWQGGIIYVCRAMTAYDRKRFIHNGIPFVVPGNQMYAPMLGIDLREHFKQVPRSGVRRLRPAAQAALVHVLAHRLYDGITASRLASVLGYTLMTAGRSCKEFEEAGLARIEARGRQRIVHFNGSGESLWKQALPFLASPVKRRMYAVVADGQVPGVAAGLTALAQYSALAAPSVPVAALTTAGWKWFAGRGTCTAVERAEDGNVCIEIWQYDPGKTVPGGIADKLSVYLSLRDTDDERVAAALDEMMESVAW